MSNQDSLSQRLHNEESNNINTVQLDLEYIFPEVNARMELGAKSIIRSQSVNTFSESYETLSQTYIEDTIANFDYLYDESIYSVYGIFGQQLNKFKYQAGVRVEKAFQTEIIKEESVPEDNELNLWYALGVPFLAGLGLLVIQWRVMSGSGH